MLQKGGSRGLTVTKTTSGYIIVADDTPLVEKYSHIRFAEAGQNVLYPMLLLHPDVRVTSRTSVKAAYDYAKARLCPVSRGGSGGRACQAGHDMQCGLCELICLSHGTSAAPGQYLCQESAPAEAISQAFRDIYTAGGTKLRKPSKRMAVRPNVDQYYDYHIDSCKAADPPQFGSPKTAHRRPSQPVVQTGDTVSCGQLIGAIPAEALGANIHAVYPNRRTGY